MKQLVIIILYSALSLSITIWNKLQKMY